ncbi:hypothetical protein Anapl_18889 [Anas platyrhynchos]|uniref:Uncharacterized protein n=1 Tax=Anas platyrhynchos TaxID=8839 RepID=R0K322_ANAPL|nr:hypothetical protein Anapl_18889 [Anas platyrhynchos]
MDLHVKSLAQPLLRLLARCIHGWLQQEPERRKGTWVAVFETSFCDSVDPLVVSDTANLVKKKKDLHFPSYNPEMFTGKRICHTIGFAADKSYRCYQTIVPNYDALSKCMVSNPAQNPVCLRGELPSPSTMLLMTDAKIFPITTCTNKERNAYLHFGERITESFSMRTGLLR